jgi:phosphoglycerate dehydrogenase-like enzyme
VSGTASLRAVRERNESAWLIPADQRRVNAALRDAMRHYDETEEVDLVVVGCGAGGSTLMQRMARHGWKIIGFDAGPFWDPEQDWVSDEAGSHTLYWTDPRTIGGAAPRPPG